MLIYIIYFNIIYIYIYLLMYICTQIFHFNNISNFPPKLPTFCITWCHDVLFKHHNGHFLDKIDVLSLLPYHIWSTSLVMWSFCHRKFLCCSSSECSYIWWWFSKSRALKTQNGEITFSNSSRKCRPRLGGVFPYTLERSTNTYVCACV